MVGILSWIVLGIIAGAIAKAIYPGNQGGGIFATMGLGIVGALVGGWLGQTFLPGAGASAASAGAAFSIPGIIFAVLGAMLCIFIWGLVTRSAA